MFWPTSVDAALVAQRVLLDGQVVATVTRPQITTAKTVRIPLGRIAGARSGDKGGKGGNANVGLWVTSDTAFQWLAETLTVECLKELLPEAADLDVERYELPNLRAFNFVINGLLGRGVADSTRFDPQAKGLGELLRARLVDAPTSILPPS